MPAVRINGVAYEEVAITGTTGRPLPVRELSRCFRAQVTLTRPDTVIGYAAGDLIGQTGSGAPVALPLIGPSGGFVLLQGVSLVFSDASLPAGMGAFRVHFFSVSPVALADNEPFDLAAGDRTSYLGFVELAVPQDAGSSLYTQLDGPGKVLKLATGSTSLFMELETRGAYTPAAGSSVIATVTTRELSV